MQQAELQHLIEICVVFLTISILYIQSPAFRFNFIGSITIRKSHRLGEM